jgi:FKBP-type peptidyl-prolyl cis-trans isomerase
MQEVGDCKEQSLRTRELPGGLMVEDLVKGEGKKAKKGRQVM